MDRRGLSGWNRSSEQDNSGGGEQASPTDAYYGSGTSEDRRDADRSYYGTNNNDYSKYAGGSGEYLPQAPGYDAFESSCAGGYYNDHSSPGHNDGRYDGYASDYYHSVYGNHGHTEYSGQPSDADDGNSQCCGEQSCHGYVPWDAARCSEYSECRGQQCRGQQCKGQQCKGQQCRGQQCQSSRVEVTAKVLFGSVSAISNLKQKKSTKKK